MRRGVYRQVESFFKWIKQYLRIKAFRGTSENAVKPQTFIALCVYVLADTVKKRIGLDQSHQAILRIFIVGLFERILILRAFLDIHP